MKIKKAKTTLSLEKACLFLAENIVQSDYLIERHSINQGADYVDVSVSAKWLPEYETISIRLIFLVSADQKNGMQDYIDNDEVRDDIDSGVGELFEEALKKQYPSYDWSYPIGEILIKCKIIK